MPSVCEEAIGLAEEAGDKWIKALALRVLAEAYSILGPSDPQRAGHAVLEAIRLLQDVDARPELARSYVTYAHLLKVKGEAKKAEDYLAKAIGMFRDMGMAWDLARAERAFRET